MKEEETPSKEEFIKRKGLFQIEMLNGIHELRNAKTEAEKRDLRFKLDCELASFMSFLGDPPSEIKEPKEENSFEKFKTLFDKNFRKVTPEQFIKEMESLGYEFEPNNKKKGNPQPPICDFEGCNKGTNIYNMYCQEHSHMAEPPHTNAEVKDHESISEVREFIKRCGYDDSCINSNPEISLNTCMDYMEQYHNYKTKGD